MEIKILGINASKLVINSCEQFQKKETYFNIKAINTVKEDSDYALLDIDLICEAYMPKLLKQVGLQVITFFQIYNDDLKNLQSETNKDTLALCVELLSQSMAHARSLLEMEAFDNNLESLIIPYYTKEELLKIVKDNFFSKLN